MHYTELKCGECGHVVKTKYAIDRMIAMCQHYKATHPNDIPCFDYRAWSTKTLRSYYSRVNIEQR